MTAKARQHNKREAAVRRFLQRAPGDITEGVKEALLESAETASDAIKLADSAWAKKPPIRSIGVKSNASVSSASAPSARRSRMSLRTS